MIKQKYLTWAGFLIIGLVAGTIINDSDAEYNQMQGHAIILKQENNELRAKLQDLGHNPEPSNSTFQLQSELLNRKEAEK